MNILVIHETVPFHDCGGADLRIFELLRELRAAEHSVTLVARLARGVDQYGPELEAMGVTVVAGDSKRLCYLGLEFHQEWDFRTLLEGRQFDIAILMHWYWNGIPVTEHYIDAIRRWSPNTCVMVLSEDRHGERERRAYELSHLLSDWERGLDFEQREAEVYRRSDLVLFVSEADHRHFEKLVPGVPMAHLPTQATLGDTGLPLEQRSGILYLGNFENLANRDSFAWFRDQVFPLLERRLTGLTLYVAGNGAGEQLCRRRPNIVSLGKVGELAPVFAERRVFVGPVRYGTGIITKNMIALAHGIPVVTTTVGAEGLGLRDGEQAFVADSPEIFAQGVFRLLTDGALWQLMSDVGRDYIRENFSIEHLREQLDKVLVSGRTMPRHKYEPDHVWSYRRVENSLPQCLTQVPAHYRPSLREFGYWQLGQEEMQHGNYPEALGQFRHIFAMLRGPVPQTVLHQRLLHDMEQCYTRLGDNEAAQRCRSALPEERLPAGSGGRTGTNARKSKNSAVNTIEISIIVPTFNRLPILQLCLVGLSYQTLPASQWELIVIDDGSTDGTERFLQHASLPFPNLVYLRQQNMGAGAARRAGVAAARGRLALFLNDDSIPTPSLLAEHLSAHRAHASERFAVLGAFHPTEECNRNALSLWLQRSTFLFPQNALKAGDVRDSRYFITCNVSLPRIAVEKAGSFDPDLPVGEDTELGARLSRLGYRVMYHPNAAAIHEHPVITTSNLLKRAEQYGPASLRLYRKHPELLCGGRSPFGTLSPADFIQMRAFVAQKQEAVDSAIAALTALDQIDLFELNRRNQLTETQLRQILWQIEQLAPLVYWHTLVRSLLAAVSAETPSCCANSPASEPQAVRT